jgi:sugar lactone lactonase YvrE
VTTLAGSGAAAFLDGQGAIAQFKSPTRMAVDSAGNVYVADTYNNRIRKITPSGLVTTLAGSGQQGFADGQGENAKFFRPEGVAVDSAGNVYVADFNNNRIRKITPSGLVTTLAGSGINGFADGQDTNAQFNAPSGLAVDSAGNVYVADFNNNRIRKITPSGLVTTLAGSGAAAFLDEQDTNAQFNKPYGVAVDSTGNVYVADYNNKRIRKITPSGLVTTLAGSGQQGFADGNGTNAQFNYPAGLAVDSAGFVYVADTNNNRIRKITPSGDVTTLAGSGQQGFADGNGANAQFNAPYGVAVISNGDVYVSDLFNNRIRKITCTPCSEPGLNQYVTSKCTQTANTVFATKQSCVTGQLSGFSAGSSSVLGSPGTCLTCNAGTYDNTKGVCETCPSGLFSSAGALVCSATCPVGTLSVIGSMCLNKCPAGKWYNNTLLQCNTCPSGTFYIGPGATSKSDCMACGPGTYSGIGSPSCSKCPVGTSFAGSQGTSVSVCTPCTTGQYSNVTGSTSCLQCPAGTMSDKGSSFCYRLNTNNTIKVTTLAGSGAAAFLDQQGTAAKFKYPPGVAVDSAGNVYVADSDNNRIRKITPSGDVTTLAGSGTRGFADGNGTNAQFNDPYGVAVDSAGNVYVADTTNHRIRKITPSGLVTTLAGSGTSGFADGNGTNAQFNDPSGVAVDSAGFVYVADLLNNRIRKITPSGLVTTLAGSGEKRFADGNGTAAKFNKPYGVAVDSAGFVYVADFNNNRVRKITPGGIVTTFAGSGTSGFADGNGTNAQFNFPIGLAVDSAGNVYVADTTNHRIRKITPSGDVTTLAGSGTSGFADGNGTNAQFNNPSGVAVDSAGNVYVADRINHRIRKILKVLFIEDAGLYIKHTTFESISFSTSGNIDIYDELVITATNVYSKGPRSLSAATYTVDPRQSTTGLVDRGSTYTTDYGFFQSGTVQYVIVYLKTPCPAATPKWDPVQKKCISTCWASTVSNVCTKCSTLSDITSVPTAGAAYCEPGFTLSGMNCNGYTCPDSSWTLSSSLCTKTELRCPNNSSWMYIGDYCLYSNGLSVVQNSVDMVQNATSVSKPAYGACVSACPQNTYKNVDRCVKCSGGQVTASTGALSINMCVCPAGTYGTNGSGVCTPCGTNMISLQGTQTQSGCSLYCPVGQYAAASGCAMCPYGTSPIGSTSVSACACATGTFLNAGTCVAQCPAGMYGDTATRACVQCPDMKTSTVGSVGVNSCMCPDGTGGSNGTGTCIQCNGGQVSTLTNLTCPDDTWTLTGSQCSKVTDYDCTGISLEDITESGQLLEPTQIDIGSANRTFTNQPTGLVSTVSFTISLDLQIEKETGSWRDLFQNVPGNTWPIDTTDRRKPSLHVAGSDDGSGRRKLWFIYSTNPGGSGNFNFGISSRSFQFTPGQWFNCTCTVDGPAKTITMYINGVQTDQATTTTSFTLSTSSSAFTWRPWNGNNDGYINVKNVYWWNRVISSDHVKLLNGLSVPNSFYKTGSTCYNTTFTYPASGCTLKSYSCPDATWKLNGSVCFKTGQPMTAATVTVSCPDPNSYTCPGGYTLSGSTCTSTTISGYSCQNGGSELLRNTPTMGWTTVKSAWALDETRCKRYQCSADTSQSGTYLTIEGNACKFYDSTYTCRQGYRKEPYAGSLRTALAGIPGCNKWSDVPDDYDVIVVKAPYTKFQAVSRSSDYCAESGPNGGWWDTKPHEKRPCFIATPIGGQFVCTGNTYNINTTNNTCSRVCPPGQTGATAINACATVTAYGPDRFNAVLVDTYRPAPNYSSVTTTVAAGDDVAASEVRDTIPASRVMNDSVVNGTLTRSQAQIMELQTTSATTQTSQSRQCSCSPGQFWNFITRECTAQCPPATYADSVTKTCKSCPANKTSPAGSTSDTQCVCSYASPYWSGVSCMQELNPTATVTVNGSGITTRYMNKYVIHEFTQTANFVVNSPIVASLLVVGGGAGGSSDGKPGNGGSKVTITRYSMNTGTYNVTVGAGGGPNSSGGNTSLTGPSTDININGGTVATSLTSSLQFRFVNLTAAILYCKYCTSDTECMSGRQCDLTTGLCKPPIESFTRTDSVKLFGVSVNGGFGNTIKKPTDCAQDCLNKADCVGFNISWQNRDPTGGDNPGYCSLYSSVTTTTNNMWYASFVKKT